MNSLAETSEKVVRAGALVVDLEAGAARYNSVRIHLTGKEYQILSFLASLKDKTVSEEQLMMHLYGEANAREEKNIDVHVCRLRKKLKHVSGGRQFIGTVWGKGYVFLDPDEDTS